MFPRSSVPMRMRLAALLFVLGGSWSPPTAWGSFTASARGPNDPPPLLNVTLHGLTKNASSYSSRYRLTNLAGVATDVLHNFYNDNNVLVANFAESLPAGQTNYYDLAQIGVVAFGYSGYVTISANQIITANVAPTLLLTGPGTALLGVAQSFTGTVQPLTLTVPITYQWSATDQSSLLDSGGLTDVASFAWDALGTKVLTLTVTSAEGFDTRTLSVLAQTQLFLPYLARPADAPLPALDGWARRARQPSR